MTCISQWLCHWKLCLRFRSYNQLRFESTRLMFLLLLFFKNLLLLSHFQLIKVFLPFKKVPWLYLTCFMRSLNSLLRAFSFMLWRPSSRGWSSWFYLNRLSVFWRRVFFWFCKLKLALIWHLLRLSLFRRQKLFFNVNKDALSDRSIKSPSQLWIPFIEIFNYCLFNINLFVIFELLHLGRTVFHYLNVWCLSSAFNFILI